MEVSYHFTKLFNIFVNGPFWPILYSALWPRTWGAWCNVLNVINQFRSATCHFISLSLNILLIYIIFPKLKLKRAIDNPLLMISSSLFFPKQDQHWYSLWRIHHLPETQYDKNSFSLLIFSKTIFFSSGSLKVSDSISLKKIMKDKRVGETMLNWKYTTQKDNVTKKKVEI